MKGCEVKVGVGRDCTKPATVRMGGKSFCTQHLLVYLHSTKEQKAQMMSGKVRLVPRGKNGWGGTVC